MTNICKVNVFHIVHELVILIVAQLSSVPLQSQVRVEWK